MNLVLEIDISFVLRRDESLEDAADRHDAFSNSHLAFLALKVRQVFHVHIEQARTHFVNGLNNVRARAHGVSYIDAASNARIHALDILQHIEWGGPHLVLGAMVVDGDADVILLYKLLDARQSFRRRITGDDDGNSGPLAVLKLVSNVRIFVLAKIDGSGSM